MDHPYIFNPRRSMVTHKHADSLSPLMGEAVNAVNRVRVTVHSNPQELLNAPNPVEEDVLV